MAAFHRATCPPAVFFPSKPLRGHTGTWIHPAWTNEAETLIWHWFNMTGSEGHMERSEAEEHWIFDTFKISCWLVPIFMFTLRRLGDIFWEGNLGALMPKNLELITYKKKIINTLTFSFHPLMLKNYLYFYSEGLSDLKMIKIFHTV